MRVGLVTCEVLPEPDFDAEPLGDALRRAGHEPVMVSWDDANADIGGVDLLALRSTWNYPEAPGAFIEWVRRAHEITPVINPPSVVEWNMHKGYLLELERAGAPIVPTWMVRRGGASALPSDDAFGGALVVKPAIGAGSSGARRFGASQREDAAAYLAELSARQDTLVQPVAPGFESPGERSIVWINGEFTHAVRKRPRFAGEDESVVSDEPATPAERELSELAIACAPVRPAYARIDVVPDEHGRAMVTELELIEPSMFFWLGASALPVFIGMLEAAMRE